MVSQMEKTLLDWIAVHESDGNYDAYIGHAHAPQGSITALTIAQVYDFQRRLIEDGEPSTAVGRYQFLQRTLSSLVQRSRYSVDMILSPSLQDNLAAMLLEDRGWAAWASRSITNEEFMHRLSCEWASLPDPYNDGRSHYDGDSAGNHAAYTLEEFSAIIATCRSQVDAVG